VPEESSPGIDISTPPGVVEREDLVKALASSLAELRSTDTRNYDRRFSELEILQNYARNAESKFQDYAREAESKFHSALREAETRRIDQVAETTRGFLATIRDMLVKSVETTNTHVGNQLLQIQSNFDTRVTKLEVYQLTQAGRSSVADPATEVTLGRITGTLSTLASQLAEMRSGESNSTGQVIGSRESGNKVLSIIMAIAAIASPIVAILIVLLTMKEHL
jgi:hypothetical protein